MSSDNPFDELELDPRLTPHELTEALRRRAEKAEGPARARIQELWRLLTVNERDRVKWAFFAHPRAEDGSASSIDALREKVPPVISRTKVPEIELTLADIAVFEDIEIDATRLLPLSIFADE